MVAARWSGHNFVRIQFYFSSWEIIVKPGAWRGGNPSPLPYTVWQSAGPALSWENTPSALDKQLPPDTWEHIKCSRGSYTLRNWWNSSDIQHRDHWWLLTCRVISMKVGLKSPCWWKYLLWLQLDPQWGKELGTDTLHSYNYEMGLYQPLIHSSKSGFDENSTVIVQKQLSNNWYPIHLLKLFLIFGLCWGF